MRIEARLAGLALALILVGTSACTGDDPPNKPIVGTLAAVDCPAEVADAVVGEVDCAWLTVPESRGRPNASLIQVLVTTVQAPSGAPDKEPMLVTGSAGQPNYAGIAPLAQRVRRDVIIVDTRGTGHSTPSLSCPEVNATAPQIWVSPDSADDLLRTAIASCHARLTSEGVDVASYDVVEAAADLETLRVALGVESWNVIAYGAGTRLAFELLRQAPDSIRTLIVDSPDVPGTDPRLLAGPASQEAVQAVLAACSRDPRCRARYPEPEALLDKAMTSLRSKPLRLSVDRQGQRVPVILDPGLLARALRQMLSDGGSSGPLFAAGSIPSVLAAVVARRERDLSSMFTQFLRYEDPLCLGYRTPCLPAMTVALGVELSMLCRDIAPFSVEPRPRLRPGFDDAYGDSSFWWVCDSWPVGTADPTVAAPPVSGVPTLVALGRFAPYSPEPATRRALAGLTAASYVTDPERPHNVLPRPCAASVRNRWTDKPKPFTDNPCPKESEISWT
jgi:pimeloyl-ACP methyl ester carboxylesterase